MGDLDVRCAIFSSGDDDGVAVAGIKAVFVCKRVDEVLGGPDAAVF